MGANDKARVVPSGATEKPAVAADQAAGPKDVDLLLDEDMDCVKVIVLGKDVINKRLHGARGRVRAELVGQVADQAAKEGYIVQRRMRRVQGTTYGMRE
jgi:hypothetical protein